MVLPRSWRSRRRVTVAVNGRVDAAYAAALRAAVLAHEAPVVLDLRNAGGIDARGAATLLRLAIERNVTIRPPVDPAHGSWQLQALRHGR